MTRRIAVAVLAVTAFVSNAEAGILHHKKSLPKPVSPGMSDKIQQDHKPGNSQRHAEKFNDPAWGRYNASLKIRDAHFGHSVTDGD